MCKICKSLLFCDECIKQDHVVLLMNLCVCEDNYYLNNKQCQLCDKKCRTCTQKSDNCLSCNSQMNRLQQQSNCICQNGYFENDNNDCWPCNSDEGKVIKQCKYQDCNDKVWTQEEECDDGNNDSRDGCTNCKIDEQYSCINVLLQPSFCFKCSENCQECQINESKNQSACTVILLLFSILNVSKVIFYFKIYVFNVLKNAQIAKLVPLIVQVVSTNKMNKENVNNAKVVTILIKLIKDVLLDVVIHLRQQKKSVMMVTYNQEMDVMNIVKKKINSFVRMEYV